MSGIQYYTCTAALFGCMLLFLFSCIKGDLSGCPIPKPLLRLELRYISEDDEVDVFNIDNIQTAHLYIFNERDSLVTSLIFDEIQMENYYDLDLTLNPGKYNFVIWFNEKDPYYTEPDVSNIKSFLEAKLSLNIPRTRTVNELPPILFYGHLADAEVKSTGENVFTIPVIQNTNNIAFTVSGLPANDDLYSFVITDNNGAYHFDNSFAPCEEFLYKTTTKFSNESTSLHDELRVLKLAANRNPHIEFRNETTGEQLYPKTINDDLVNLILSAYPNNDFDRKHRYRIALDYENDMSRVTISVDGWKVTSSEEEIIPE
jgi:hypothetical protein